MGNLHLFQKAGSEDFIVRLLIVWPGAFLVELPRAAVDFPTFHQLAIEAGVSGADPFAGRNDGLQGKRREVVGK